QLLEVKPANPASAETQASLEFHRNPLRIIANFQREAFPVSGDAGRVPIGTYFEGSSQLATGVGGERIFRSGNIGVQRRAIALDGHAHAAFAKFVISLDCRAQAECALAPF